MYDVGLNGVTSIVPHLPYNLLPGRVESYLKSSDTIQDGDQVCYPCYKFFNLKLKFSECMLSNEDVV